MGCMQSPGPETATKSCCRDIETATHGLSPWELHGSALQKPFAKRKVSMSHPALSEESHSGNWERSQGLQGAREG